MIEENENTNAPQEEGSNGSESQKTSDAQDHSAYMPSADTPAPTNGESTPALSEEEAAVPETTRAETVSTPAPTQGFGFERQNQELLWVSQKVSDVRAELGKYIIGQHERIKYHN